MRLNNLEHLNFPPVFYRCNKTFSENRLAECLNHFYGAVKEGGFGKIFFMNWENRLNSHHAGKVCQR